MMNIQKNLKLIHQDIERLINEGETEEAKKVLASLRDKAQELREEVSRDDQEIRKLTISVNRRKDLIESIDNLVISMYSKAIHTEKGSTQND